MPTIIRMFKADSEHIIYEALWVMIGITTSSNELVFEEIFKPEYELM